jgi:hypothetical protein
VNKILKETCKNNPPIQNKFTLKFQNSQEAAGVNAQKELDERNLQNMRKSSEPHSSSSRKKKSDLQSSERLHRMNHYNLTPKYKNNLKTQNQTIFPIPKFQKIQMLT